MPDILVHSLPTKVRRLSAPGRRRSFGIELKASAATLSSSNRNIASPDASPTKALRAPLPHAEAHDPPTRPTTPAADHPTIAAPVRLRAPARGATKSKLEALQKQNFRAPIREARPGDQIVGYTCPECEAFAELLRSEKVHDSVIQAASRHRYFCAPSSTPPNLWEPWQIDSYPSSLT